jgi:hypothetical protein
VVRPFLWVLEGVNLSPVSSNTLPTKKAEEKHRKDVLLLEGCIHPAAQLVTAVPKGAINVAFLDRHSAFYNPQMSYLCCLQRTSSATLILSYVASEYTANINCCRGEDFEKWMHY